MYLFGFFGPIRAHMAHMGPYGPVSYGMGPARAHEEREKFRKTAPFQTHFLSETAVFDLHITFIVVLTCPSDFWPKYASLLIGPGPGPTWARGPARTMTLTVMEWGQH